MFEIMTADKARANTKEMIALLQEKENAEYERAFNQVFEYNAQYIQDSIYAHTLAQYFSCEYEFMDQYAADKRTILGTDIADAMKDYLLSLGYTVTMCTPDEEQKEYGIACVMEINWRE